MPKRKRESHIFDRERDDWYVEPHWLDYRFFQIEDFDGSIYDPFCGMGRMVMAARRARYKAEGTDLVNRGFGKRADFFKINKHKYHCDNIVSNPPFYLLREAVSHALTIARRKVAFIAPSQRINAAHWLKDTPLETVYFISPRPSMGPGNLAMRGIESRGDRKDYVFFVWSHAYRGKHPQMKWLIRKGHGDEQRDGNSDQDQ